MSVLWDIMNSRGVLVIVPTGTSFFFCVYITQTDHKALEILADLGMTLSLIGIILTILGYVVFT